MSETGRASEAKTVTTSRVTRQRRSAPADTTFEQPTDEQLAGGLSVPGGRAPAAYQERCEGCGREGDYPTEVEVRDGRVLCVGGCGE